MPYVPSKKTNPPAEDRKILDPNIEVLARDLEKRIYHNQDLSRIYEESFDKLCVILRDLLTPSVENLGDSKEKALAEAICQVSKNYNYWGAHLGELNYSITRLIQRVPQIKVEQGKWEEGNELRYWVYASTVSALIHTSRKTEVLGMDLSGVFEDIKDEYKWKVNRSYEIAQVLKSGDAYDTPYYMKIIELVDEDGNLIGHQEVALKRSPETIDLDLLPWQIVVKKKS